MPLRRAALPDDVFRMVEGPTHIVVTDVWRDDLLSALREATAQFPEKRVIFSQDALDPELQILKGFEHLQHLAIKVRSVTSFDVLAGFTELRNLELGETYSKKPTLSFVENCSKLEEIWIEGHAKGFESLARLTRLKILRLRTSKVRDFDALAEHPSIERIEILFSGVRNLSPLASIPHLKRLWLSHVRKLTGEDLKPLAKSSLEMLALNDEPKIEDFVPLGHPEITHLSLDNLAGLRSVRALADWPILSMLGLRRAYPSDHDLLSVCRNPALRHLAIEMQLQESELAEIQSQFDGDSLSHMGRDLVGETPSRIVASRIDL